MNLKALRALEGYSSTCIPLVVEEHKAQRGHATCPRSQNKAGRRPPCLASECACVLGPARNECRPPLPRCRQTCPCCRGNSCTAPAWPSRPLPSTWPSTSSSCWMPTPPPPSTPRSSSWKSTRTAKGGHLTGKGASCGCGAGSRAGSCPAWLSRAASGSPAQQLPGTRPTWCCIPWPAASGLRPWAKPSRPLHRAGCGVLRTQMAPPGAQGRVREGASAAETCLALIFGLDVDPSVQAPGLALVPSSSLPQQRLRLPDHWPQEPRHQQWGGGWRKPQRRRDSGVLAGPHVSCCASVSVLWLFLFLCPHLSSLSLPPGLRSTAHGL